MTEPSEEKVLEAVRQTASDGRIPCATARRLAEDLGIDYGRVGAAADTAGVRIVSCELGCF
jgi:hypothetical protein